MATSAILSFPFCVQRLRPPCLYLRRPLSLEPLASIAVMMTRPLPVSSIRVSTDHPILVEPGLDIALELLDRPAFQNCPYLR